MALFLGFAAQVCFFFCWKIQSFYSPEKASTVGIDCGKWECRRRSSRKSPKITFYTWDFAGQVYSAGGLQLGAIKAICILSLVG